MLSLEYGHGGVKMSSFSQNPLVPNSFDDYCETDIDSNNADGFSYIGFSKKDGSWAIKRTKELTPDGTGSEFRFAFMKFNPGTNLDKYEFAWESRTTLTYNRKHGAFVPPDGSLSKEDDDLILQEDGFEIKL